MESHQPLERVRQIGAFGGLAAAERLALGVVSVRQMVDAGEKSAELAPVGHHPAYGDAAESDSVIGALAPDQADPAALAADTMIGERDLERAVDRLGP